jgi:hypothetical protein
MLNPASNTPNPLQPISVRAAESAGDLLGPPPVVSGEDPDAFLELLDCVREDVKPKGIIEEIWVRDIVNVDLMVVVPYSRAWLSHPKRNLASG